MYNLQYETVADLAARINHYIGFGFVCHNVRNLRPQVIRFDIYAIASVSESEASYYSRVNSEFSVICRSRNISHTQFPKL